MAVAKEWFTVDEAAEYLGVSRRTVYKLASEGRLPPYLLGHQRTRRFRKRDLDKVPRRAIRPPLRRGVEQPEALLLQKGDPLAELWDNEDDAIYDNYPSR